MLHPINDVLAVNIALEAIQSLHSVNYTPEDPEEHFVGQVILMPIRTRTPPESSLQDTIEHLHPVECQSVS